MGNVYDELGVKTFINAAGTYTIAGGSKMSRKTLDDIKEASSRFVLIRELQAKVHSEIAKMTKNEAAYVSNGAAAGLYLAIAAAIQIRHGESRFIYLDKKVISSYNVVMFKSHRNPYDMVIGDLGAQYRELGFPNIILPVSEEDLLTAIDENTAAVYYAEATWTAPGTLPLENVLRIADKRGVPVIVDAAAQLPPADNLWKFTKMGAAVVLFSGGKDLRGPQSSGLIVGKKEFIDVVASLGFPNYGIGRMLKVGREELIGLYSAVRQYVEMDHKKRREWCEKQVEKVLAAFEESEMFTALRSFPNEAGQPIPRALLTLRNPQTKATVICRKLMEAPEAIYVCSDEERGIFINPMTMCEGETEIVIEALKKIESEAGQDEKDSSGTGSTA